MGYATKICLACRVATTQTHRDAIVTLHQARRRAVELFELEVLGDHCVDVDTGEIAGLAVVSDNGSAFTSSGFAFYAAGHFELRHVRTQRRARRPAVVMERSPTEDTGPGVTPASVSCTSFGTRGRELLRFSRHLA